MKIGQSAAMHIKNFVRQISYRWVKNRDVKIVTGVGKGLRFNAGESNPAYSLGTNELPVQKALIHYLKPGDVFFDVGANVGFFSVLGAEQVGETGRVFVFEPVPENMEWIKHNCKLNGFSNVTFFEYAVSDSTGEANLLLAEYSGGAALATAGRPPDFKGEMVVKVVSLDELIFNKELDPPSVVKIDVEGAEANVLRGMQKIIEKYKPAIIFEVDDHDELAFNEKLDECRNFLDSHSYAISRLDDSYTGSGWLVGNFVATPKD